jgi:gluconolactonase
VLAVIQVEVPMVTSVCFGGEGLGDLYIVTGDRGAPPDVGGAVYRMPAPVPGLPVGPARVTPA